MLNKMNTGSGKEKIIIYIVLTLITFFVYGQVNRFDFVNLDDVRYVTENSYLQSGLTFEGFRWAFSTTYAEFWHPLTWLSLMFDYQFHGLNPGGYHLTNLILHILSTLMLFWLFCHMTNAIWKSAFVAAFFALHPLHVESVAWISERKDVLSAFFWMLTLCFYVRYAEKPATNKYLFVIFSFVCALMSKPMAVTLPVIMILLDYWPLNRFESRKNDLIRWQLKEKIPFFILSTAFSILTIYAQRDLSGKHHSLYSRLSGAPVSFMTYLNKLFLPFDLTVFYRDPDQVTNLQVTAAVFFIIIISTVVTVMVKRWPYLFVGWFWYAITILPTLGVIQTGIHWIHDLYTYLPSIGISIVLAWGIPFLIKNESVRINVLFPAVIVFCIVLAALTWKQCGYWKNSETLFRHNLQITENNFMAHHQFGLSVYNQGKFKDAIAHYNKAISINPLYAPAYNNRGNAYGMLNEHQAAIEDYNKAILLLKPAPAQFYMNRGSSYAGLGNYRQAMDDFNHAAGQSSKDPAVYNNMGFIFIKLGRYQQAMDNFNKAIDLNRDYAYSYVNRGIVYAKLGQYQPAMNDFNKAISLKNNDANAYSCRATIHLSQNDIGSGCFDAQKACGLGNCKVLDAARSKGYCH